MAPHAAPGGNRRISITGATGEVTTLADRWQSKRFNSPNDLVYKSDGSLYFTDPPYGFLDPVGAPTKDLDKDPGQIGRAHV